MIVGLSGKINSGKSTVSEIFKNNGYYIDSFAKSVKDVCSNMFDFDRNKLEGFTEEDRLWRETQSEKYTEMFGSPFTPRDALILIGTTIGRKIHPDIWIETVFNRYEKNINKNLLISDVRFPNEYDSIKKKGGIIIRINRTNNSTNLIHESECALDHHTFDYVIENDGTIEELNQKILQILVNISVN